MRTLLLLICLLVCPALWAENVSVPLYVDYPYLRGQVARVLVGNESGKGPVELDDCAELALSELALDPSAGALTVRAVAEITPGQWLFGECVQLKAFTGELKLRLLPEVDAGGELLRFSVVDSSFRGLDGRRALKGRVWDLVKHSVHVRLSRVDLDLREPIGEMRAFLGLVAQPGESEAWIALLRGARIDTFEVGADELRLGVAITLPERAAAAEPTEAEPELSEAELDAFQARHDAFDAVLTLVIKRVASGTDVEDERREMLATLLDARYAILAALAEPAERGRDPVRALFLDSWQRLRPILRQVARRQPPGEATLRMISFVTAADALSTLDALGDHAGIEISVQGLRRLARMLVPDARSSELDYRDEVDPELREIFDFEPPEPDSREAQGQSPTAALFEWLVPAAHAADDEPANIAERWSERLPAQTELPAYLVDMRTLLDAEGGRRSSDSRIKPDYAALVLPLIRATGWKESCWRQYVKGEGGLIALKSSVGALGLMQVSPRVWRGFYDTERLATDVRYNIESGSDILVHYLVDYALRKGEHTHPGGLDNLVRATYSAYNGGPGQLARYRKESTPARLRSIDNAFWNAYTRLSEGALPSTRRCWGVELSS